MTTLEKNGVSCSRELPAGSFPRPTAPIVSEAISHWNRYSIKTKTEDSQDDQEKAISYLQMDNNFDFIIYTDGSADEGTHNGGSGIVITTGSTAKPTITDRWNRPAGKYCSSFEA